MKNSGGSGGYRGRRQEAGNREKILDSEYRSRDKGFGMSARGLKPRHPESRRGGSSGGIPRLKTWRMQTEVRPGKVADGRNQDEKLRRVRRIQGPETGSREQGKDFGFGIPEQGQRFRNVGAGAETPASGKQTGWKFGWNSPVKDMENADGSETGKDSRGCGIQHECAVEDGIGGPESDSD